KTDPPICTLPAGCPNAGDLQTGTTRYAYDARDNLTQVTDPAGVTTQYKWSGLDDERRETSPDAGTSTFTPDSAGNLQQRTWANHKSATYGYDALGRRVSEDYGSGVTVSYTYDGTDNGNHGIGHLTKMVDPSGSTSWRYDLMGRLVRRVQTVGARVLTTQFD